jgi:hypothetical protein
VQYKPVNAASDCSFSGKFVVVNLARADAKSKKADHKQRRAYVVMQIYQC